MENVIEKEKTINFDGITIKKLPDCPKCGRNEYMVSGNGEFLKCPCGQKYFNKGRV